MRRWRPQIRPSPVASCRLSYCNRSRSRAEEQRLGLQLLPLHRRIYLEVGNGGDIGGGLFGVRARRGGHYDEEGHSLAEVKASLFEPAHPTAEHLVHAVTLAYVDYVQWVWVDTRDGRILLDAEEALYRSPLDFNAYWEHSLGGTLEEALSERGPDRLGINPFTRKETVFQSWRARGGCLFRYVDQR